MRMQNPLEANKSPQYYYTKECGANRQQHAVWMGIYLSWPCSHQIDVFSLCLVTVLLYKSKSISYLITGVKRLVTMSYQDFLLSAKYLNLSLSSIIHQTWSCILHATITAPLQGWIISQIIFSNNF